MTEERDVRIYVYRSGTLEKVRPGKHHKTNSIESAKLKVSKLSERWYRGCQFVLVEYTGNYKSKIIEVI